jgi:hypothetical protein
MVRYLTTNGKSNTYGLHNPFALRYRRVNGAFYELIKIDGPAKVAFPVFLSFRRKPESSQFNMFWMPDQVRHDDLGTFCRENA